MTFNGSQTNSTNPPANTPAIMLMHGAGGGARSTAHGGGGALIELPVTLPASSTIRIGRGGPGGNNTTVSTVTVFNGGARGAAPVSGTAFGKAYGGGATSWNGGAGFIAGGGGGSGSPEDLTLRGTIPHGGDAGLFAAPNTSTNIEAGQPGSANGGGLGGAVGGAVGSLAATSTPANGGSGAAQLATGGGGGGGGGGKGSGGGAGNYTPPPNTVSGGGQGGGGSSLGYNATTSHAARNGKTHASPLNPLGDGAIGNAAGNHGVAQFHWRTCTTCPCTELPAGLPPALFICLTLEQFNTLSASAGAVPTNCGGAPPRVAFLYKGWPYSIGLTDAPVADDRPCDRVPLSADISGGRFVSSTNYCCRIWSATRFVGTTGNCTPACDGEGCVNTIYFCDKYRHETLGIDECDLIAGKCVFISYNSCSYVVNPTPFDGSCTTPAPSPLNVGEPDEVREPPCNERSGGVWTVGPNIFTGGFSCGFGMNLNWDASSVEWAAPSAACRSMVGNWSGRIDMSCLYYFTGRDTCDTQAAPCSCLMDFDGTCNLTLGRKAVTREALCNVTGAPFICNDPCACSGWYTNFGGLPGQFGDSWFSDDENAVGGLCPEPSWVTALTITRNCAHPSGSPVISVDGNGGFISIDGCTFEGNGTAAQFADKINAVLGDRLTATGSSLYWFGPRWRGTKAYPADFECSGGTGLDGSNGDNVLLVSNTSTTATIAAQYSSRWRLSMLIKSVSNTGSYDNPQTPEVDPECGCSNGNCHLQGVYFSTLCAIEKPHVNITAADFGGLTLLPNSKAMSCLQPVPENTAIPSIVVLS